MSVGKRFSFDSAPARSWQTQQEYEYSLALANIHVTRPNHTPSLAVIIALLDYDVLSVTSTSARTTG
jgi:hypothetical protein